MTQNCPLKKHSDCEPLPESDDHWHRSAPCAQLAASTRHITLTSSGNSYLLPLLLHHFRSWGLLSIDILRRHILRYRF